jgi:hypothetical protein
VAENLHDALQNLVSDVHGGIAYDRVEVGGRKARRRRRVRIGLFTSTLAVAGVAAIAIAPHNDRNDGLVISPVPSASPAPLPAAQLSAVPHPVPAGFVLVSHNVVGSTVYSGYYRDRQDSQRYFTVAVTIVSSGFAAKDQAAAHAPSQSVRGYPGYIQVTTGALPHVLVTWSESPTRLINVFGQKMSKAEVLDLASRVF